MLLPRLLRRSRGEGRWNLPRGSVRPIDHRRRLRTSDHLRSQGAAFCHTDLCLKQQNTGMTPTEPDAMTDKVTPLP